MWITGLNSACYQTSFSGQLVLDSLSCYAAWPEFFCMFCYLGKLPLRMSRVFYRTVLWVIMIYNSETTCSILTKFSGNKRSDMENMLAKFRCPKMVAMETVTDSLFFFNAWYLSRGWNYYLDILWICSPGPKVQFMFRTYFLQTYRFSVIMQQTFREGHVDARA